MVESNFRIKINSDEKNKDSGFYALITSGTSIICLDNEEYIVNERAIKNLNDKRVIYELVTDT